MKIRSPKYIIDLARKLRLNPMPCELLLWAYLSNKNILSFKFRRQHPVGRYILDFYCSKKNLAIEIDGSSHKYKKDEDRFRDDFLESCGIKTLRFSNDEVFNNFDEIIEKIKKELKTEVRPPGD